MVSSKCINHFKMLWSVSGTYCGKVALRSPILYIYIYSMIYTVNHFLTTGTKQKVPKEKPVDQVAMTKTLDQILQPKISPPPGIPIDQNK